MAPLDTGTWTLGKGLEPELGEGFKWYMVGLNFALGVYQMWFWHIAIWGCSELTDPWIRINHPPGCFAGKHHDFRALRPLGALLQPSSPFPIIAKESFSCLGSLEGHRGAAPRRCLPVGIRGHPWASMGPGQLDLYTSACWKTGSWTILGFHACWSSWRVPAPFQVWALDADLPSRLALSGSADTSLILWDLERLESLRSFEGTWGMLMELGEQCVF